MAKATKAVGPSFTEEELADPSPPVTVTRAVLGGELLSHGMDSSQSSESETRSSDLPTPNLREPARMMDSLSSQPGTEADDDVQSTDGDGLRTDPDSTEGDDDFEEESTTTPKRARTTRSKAVNPKAARVRSTGDDFDDFA